jgi:hypothetical protein
MTRETKLGLVIGTSFVSLVAVVLYNTLTRTEETTQAKDVVEDVRAVGADKAPPAQDQTPFQPGTVIPAAVQQVPNPPPAPLPPGPVMVSQGPGLPALPPGLPPNNGQLALPPSPALGPALGKLEAGPGEPERLWMPEVEYVPAYGSQPQPVAVADNNRQPAAPLGLDPKLQMPPGLEVSRPGDPQTPSGLPGLTGDLQVAKPGSSSGDPPPPPKVPQTTGTAVTVGEIPIPSPSPSPLRPNNPPPAQVESHVETLVLAEPGDDLASISKKYFNSPDYAQALYAFNRDHPAQPLSDDSGLQPGGFKAKTSVYVPDAALLQKRYGQLIQAPGSAAAQPTPAVPQYVSVTPLKQVQPQEANVPPPPPMPQGGWSTPSASAKEVAVTPQGGWSTPSAPAKELAVTPPTPTPVQAGNTKPYWVPAGGKYYYEIARETLGDGTRWGDIWRLNTNYPPENQIPAGAQLRLPPDARVQ